MLILGFSMCSINQHEKHPFLCIIIDNYRITLPTVIRSTIRSAVRDDSPRDGPLYETHNPPHRQCRTDGRSEKLSAGWWDQQSRTSTLLFTLACWQLFWTSEASIVGDVPLFKALLSKKRPFLSHTNNVDITLVCVSFYFNKNTGNRLEN